MGTKKDEFQGIFVLQPILSILQPLLLNNGRRTKNQSYAESCEIDLSNNEFKFARNLVEFRKISRIRGEFMCLHGSI